MELQCDICSEWWSSLTDDLDEDELAAIRAGQGCPSCMGNDKESGESDEA